jgi:transposase InsO family protein
MVSEEAKKKVRILAFWEKHGLEATLDAYDVKKRTLYMWKSLLKRSEGRPEILNNKSRAPRHRRRREWHPDVITEIKRVRKAYPNLGKEKIFVHLHAFCTERNLRCPKSRTIGRIIFDAPGKMRIFPKKVHHDGKIFQKKPLQTLRKPKGFKAEHPGHCVALDTIEIILWGKRIYIITMIDLYSRYALAHVTTSHASLAAKEFFDRIKTIFPYEIMHVLTDNGSEFMKHFDEELRRLCLTHWRTYPRTPKMNAHCERFNRTIQEEFLIHHTHLLSDPPRCNQELDTWLLWYNEVRPHWGLDLQSPMQFIHEYEKTVNECKM